MAKQQQRRGRDVNRLHPRNPHQGRYDFDKLCLLSAELTPYVIESRSGDRTIDFHDPLAVKALNKALLMQSYGVQFWDIPAGYLCPPIPGRADYIHYLADELAIDNGGVVPEGRMIQGLDIGVGANCIYPLIGNRTYGWQFVGTDIDPISVNTANLIAEANPSLKGQIHCRLQGDAKSIFKGVVKPSDRFDFTLCNPPFHGSAQESEAANRRKRRHLGQAEAKLNFGGQSNELWCSGGELAFIKRIITESRTVAEQCYLFSCLVSKQDNIAQLTGALKSAGAKRVKVVAMSQGQKQSRLLLWTFLSQEAQQQWREGYWGDK
ncbi:23S rRNA (adenine(1618)-N(6))-methyltransferase RlmF [Amphritea sp. 2_MG-2023]|uniref:23S rRNA (adenine(1618)-N(6))-methyltransferase RlmF n=1 Tax=Amphritea TaxID=515417 RepID=UPI001C078781|nr:MULTISPECIES: 23S rRNA (adenine(1618)-N(6))-methyltransferase RlmF [Amphritea]MBU2964543.1 23S rRNA (adenine(1618)-N(6))-methyltransferase RlmF [Amphritea atlantica]MDO6417872.1 23S rRNA (adenine(1618)-N(6))-methyltransferase RlmF [Amphritea sp. 2_MG-2023]